MNKPSGKPFCFGSGAVRRSAPSYAVIAAVALSAALCGTARGSGVGVPPAQAPDAAQQARPATEAAPAQKAPTEALPISRLPIEIRPQPNAEQLETWRRAILKVPAPKEGCFTADYPDTGWREAPCRKPPHKLYPPHRPGMVRTEQVGGTSDVDFSPTVTGHITEAEGSFDPATSVTSECEVQCPGPTFTCPASPSCTGEPANSYTLQLNSAPFDTSVCSTSALNGSATTPCQGWEQFVYAQDENCTGCLGDGFIQYWILNWGNPGATCPSPAASSATCSASGGVVDGQWCAFQFTSTDPVYCVINATNSATPPTENVTSLTQLKMSGDAAGGGATTDSVTVWEGSTPYKATGGNYFPDLGTQWQEVEFNIFGDGGGSEAVFNNGANIAVRSGVTSGTTDGPGCDLRSFTGESNNLTLATTAPPAVKGNMPALLFSQNSTAAAGATCADATSVGDTHITTFDGLYYDFQASGDYVLVDTPDFTVHARQASGAPTWPNAAVNKAIAMLMDKTRVEIYIQPTRLLIDGRMTNLVDSQPDLLPTGVQITRRGNVFIVSSESGNRVSATLNATWIDVTVGLGRTPAAQAHGLLGNPVGDAHRLFTAAGRMLNEPVSFDDLYETYGDSWRVPAGKSLFTGVNSIVAANPSKAFFAADLEPAQATQAKAACKAAGVTDEEMLNSCTLDRAVLNNALAVKAFTVARLPIHVVRPVMLKAPVAH